MNAAIQAMENMQYARRRWLILATVAIAQLMIVLDLTIVNVALPSAQQSLHFATVDRQWVVTAYALAFGSLLLLGGRLADLLGRKVTFMAGLAGFAVASAVGGASVTFAMLVTVRACQGAFAAVMAPSALSILTNTFADPRDRGKAFAVFGAIAGAGASVGLLLGGVLTEYLSWRWTLYVNLLFAGAALISAAMLLKREPARGGQRLDLPGAVLVGGAMFCLVYGFANAATHSWRTPSTWGFLVAAGAGLVAFAARQARAKDPLLPRVVLDRNRGGAYLAMLFVSAGVFGIFLFLAFYLQTTLNRGSILAGHASVALVQQSLVHGYVVGFWWTAGIFAAGAVVWGTLLRRGPLRPWQAPAATAPEPEAVRSGSPSVRLRAR